MVILGGIVIFLGHLAAIVSGQCTYDFNVTPLTSFINATLSPNIFGYVQGNVGGGSVVLKNGSLEIQFTSDNDYFYVNVCPNQAGNCFDVSGYQVIGISVANFDSSWTKSMDDDVINMRFNGNQDYQMTFNSKRFSVNSETNVGTFYQPIPSVLDAGLRQVEIRVFWNKLKSPWQLKEISLVNIVPKCAKTNGLNRDRGFVWRNQSVLMLGDKPFKFISFYVFQMEMLTRKEMEDIVKTVAIFANGGSKVIKLYSFMSIKGNGYQCTGDDDCFILGKQKYNEHILMNIDNLLDLCRAYGVKVIIPFAQAIYEFSTFSAFYSYQADEFYTVKVLKEYLFFVNLVLNRTNTVNGIAYKEDNTILAWETGTDLSIGGRVPSLEWFLAISSHIKSQAPNHLISDSTIDVDNFESFNNPFSDIITFTSRWWWDATDLKFLNTIQKMALLFGKPVYADQLPLASPTPLNEKLTQVLKFIVGSYTAFNTTNFAGVFITCLAGRKEGVGFNMVKDLIDQKGLTGIHYPGFEFDTLTNLDYVGSPQEKLQV